MSATEFDDEIIVISPEDLALATPEEREQYRRYLIGQAVLRDQWEGWLRALAPKNITGDFAPHHIEFWRWVWSIEPEVRSLPWVSIWPRGGGKSSSAELAVAALGARGKRRYCLYVSETQDQADDHLANIASLLEAEEIGLAYPEIGERLLNKFGHTKGWNRNRIRTATGFTVDAIGLDSAARGIKLDDMRPDLIVLDDIDSEQDNAAGVARKVKTLTRKLLPSGSTDCCVMAIQNKVHDDSIFAMLADGRADFLRDRILSGPIPAVKNLEWAERDGLFEIIGGEPSWTGQSLATCQGFMNTYGLTAFLAECQHSTLPPSGGMFDHIPFHLIRVTEAELPDFRRVVVWVDPAVTSTDNSDSQGISVTALGEDEMFYRLYSWEGVTTPLAAIKRALRQAIEWGADTLGVETDQGGDTWESVYREACAMLREEQNDDGSFVLVGSAPKFASEKAGSGHGSKANRAQRMLVDYERGRFRHLEGTHGALEMALRRFPKVKPYDLVDASYWSWKDLSAGLTRRRARARSAARRQLTGVSMN